MKANKIKKLVLMCVQKLDLYCWERFLVTHNKNIFYEPLKNIFITWWKYLGIEIAEKALNENLGIVLEGKPLIIQFGKKCLSSTN